MEQLTTKREVYDNSPIGKLFPEKLICDRIQTVEEAFIRECLGDEFYEAMVEHLTDVSEAKNWECGVYYEEGEIVTRSEYYYTSLQKNQADPANKSDVGFWVRTDKFDNDCWNGLWGYLVKIIAHKVYSKALPYSVVESGAGGLTVQEKDPRGVRAAYTTDVTRQQASLQSDINDFLVNMKAWMNKAAQKDCFPANPFTSVCKDDCSTSRPVGRRFILRDEYY